MNNQRMVENFQNVYKIFQEDMHQKIIIKIKQTKRAFGIQIYKSN